MTSYTPPPPPAPMPEQAAYPPPVAEQPPYFPPPSASTSFPFGQAPVVGQAPATQAPATQAPTQAPAAKAPPVAWLVPLAGLLALVGGALPWFKPIGYFPHHHHQTIGLVAHAWQGGAVGVLGPVLLVVIGAIVLRRLLSARPTKPGRNPVRRAGILAVLFAIITVALQGAARALIYHSTVTVNGKSIKIDDYAAAVGAHAITHGTQLGFWITTAAAVIALVGGIAMFVVGKKA